jgi:nicotinate-nucleotide pyrophosphorylase (carboxylating)
MENTLMTSAIKSDLEYFFSEDDLSRNIYYTSKLPTDLVKCSLKIKDDMTLAGLPWLLETFRYLGDESLSWDMFKEFEGKKFKKNDKAEIHFELPFALALTGERIALNLVQRASSIATYASQFIEKAKDTNIKILDTRKTTPGLRSLEKYATRTGGANNHRLGQTDMWMVKDNHKTFFGGVNQAVDFFKSMQGFYTPIEVEIHDIAELSHAIEMNIKHVMLDNFTPEQVKEAIAMKPQNMTYEVSGGINLDNIENYLIEGLDAISIGAMTYGARPVDLSLKYHR